MARGTLHPAKSEGRRRTNAPTLGAIELTRDGIIRGVSLVEAAGENLPDGWHSRTLDWWETWRAAPQAQAFEETDWRRLAMLAVLVDAFNVKPQAAAMSEIRLNEERLGATVIDRVRARMTISDEPTELTSVAPIRRAPKVSPDE